MKYLLFGIVWLGWTAVSIYAVGLIWTSVKSKEYRAACLGGLLILGLLGMATLGVIGHLGEALCTRVFLLMGGSSFVLLPLFMLIPFGKYENPLQGTKGYVVGDVKRFDERDQAFARNRSLRPGRPKLIKRA